MEMSKCLCVLIIAVIVIAANASPFRERRSGGNYQRSGNTNVNYQQTNITNTNNNCNGANQVCCNNYAESKTNNRGKRNSGSWGNPDFYVNHPTNSNKQIGCYNGATNGTSGDQTTGCSTNQSCCQGNTDSTGSIASISCSNVNLGGN
ncbi:unnamed protein product [Adineta steineri]|uniref:Hydrophobin n=1 Tax=Adineta steineri TaxID=433720 RepID=A0A819EPK6_9BILA|nr:unnamed protein product [Adineta steineri]CAF3853358.1 unnamed protein product [Adineta steineri]